MIITNTHRFQPYLPCFPIVLFIIRAWPCIVAGKSTTCDTVTRICMSLLSFFLLLLSLFILLIQIVWNGAHNIWQFSINIFWIMHKINVEYDHIGLVILVLILKNLCATKLIFDSFDNCIHSDMCLSDLLKPPIIFYIYVNQSFFMLLHDLLNISHDFNKLDLIIKCGIR